MEPLPSGGFLGSREVWGKRRAAGPVGKPAAAEGWWASGDLPTGSALAAGPLCRAASLASLSRPLASLRVDHKICICSGQTIFPCSHWFCAGSFATLTTSFGRPAASPLVGPPLQKTAAWLSTIVANDIAVH